MAKTMKALMKKERAPGLTLTEVEIPEIGPNDVLIKITKTAICGTDLHIYNWDEWSQKLFQCQWLLVTNMLESSTRWVRL